MIENHSKLVESANKSGTRPPDTGPREVLDDLSGYIGLSGL